MKAVELAKYIINKCIDLEKPVSNLQLQKILYLVYTGFLKQTGQRLFRDNDFEAWSYGPIIGECYYKWSIFGSNKLACHEDVDLYFNDEELALLHNLVAEALELKPWELVDKTQSGYAYKQTYEKGSNKYSLSHKVIPHYLIEYECGLIDKLPKNKEEDSEESIEINHAKLSKESILFFLDAIALAADKDVGVSENRKVIESMKNDLKNFMEKYNIPELKEKE